MIIVDHFDEMIADLEDELARVRAEPLPSLIAPLERKIRDLKAMRDARCACTTIGFPAAA